MSGKETYIFTNGLMFIPSLGVIQSDGTSQKLNLSEQYILLYLIKHSDRPVTKNELIQAGWPDRVVSEASLFQIIRSLRLKLHEKTTGEVIATLPRIGYQLTQITTKIHTESTFTEQKKTNRHIVTFAVSILFTLVVLGTAGKYWLARYKHPAQPINFIRTTMLNNNTLTLISVTEDGLDDLYQKIHNLYIELNNDNNPIVFENLKIYAYKGDKIYSLAWCKMDSEQLCLPHTDVSYQIKHNDWSLFRTNALDQIPRERSTPIIQTEFARETASQTHLYFVDKSGINSQVVYRYRSKDMNGALNYSSLKFIFEKGTDYYHTLSFNSTIMTELENESPFMATYVLMPNNYNLMYQNNSIINEDNSTALMIEHLIQKQFKNKIVSYNYLLYQRPNLDLMLNHTYGLYWVHSNTK